MFLKVTSPFIAPVSTNVGGALAAGGGKPRPGPLPTPTEPLQPRTVWGNMTQALSQVARFVCPAMETVYPSGFLIVSHCNTYLTSPVMEASEPRQNASTSHGQAMALALAKWRQTALLPDH